MYVIDLIHRRVLWNLVAEIRYRIQPIALIVRVFCLGSLYFDMVTFFSCAVQLRNLFLFCLDMLLDNKQRLFKKCLAANCEEVVIPLEECKYCNFHYDLHFFQPILMTETLEEPQMPLTNGDSTVALNDCISILDCSSSFEGDAIINAVKSLIDELLAQIC